MCPNIRVIVSSLNSLMVTTLKCRTNLGVMGFLPPPGGPMAAIIWMSINCSLLVSFLSYLHNINGTLNGKVGQEESELKMVKGELKMVKGELKMVKGELMMVKGELKMVKGELKMVKGELMMVKGELVMVRVSSRWLYD